MSSDSQTFNHQWSRELHSEDEVNTLAFSGNGQYLASGGDMGYISVFETRTWQLVRSFRAKHRIRTLIWHPRRVMLISGSSNGDVNRVLFRHEGADRQLVQSVDGCVHALDISADGSQLAVAYEQDVLLVDLRADIWNALQCLPRPNDPDSEGNILPQNVHHLCDGNVVVSFLHHGIWVYSTKDNSVLWHIQSRTGLIGSSALSRDEKILAVTNLTNGIDFYSVELQALVASGQHDTQSELNDQRGIAFIDKEGQKAVSPSGSRISVFCLGIIESVSQVDAGQNTQIRPVASTILSGKALTAVGGARARDTRRVKYSIDVFIEGPEPSPSVSDADIGEDGQPSEARRDASIRRSAGKKDVPRRVSIYPMTVALALVGAVFLGMQMKTLDLASPVPSQWYSGTIDLINRYLAASQEYRNAGPVLESTITPWVDAYRLIGSTEDATATLSTISILPPVDFRSSPLESTNSPPQFPVPATSVDGDDIVEDLCLSLPAVSALASASSPASSSPAVSQSDPVQSRVTDKELMLTTIAGLQTTTFPNTRQEIIAHAVKDGSTGAPGVDQSEREVVHTTTNLGATAIPFLDERVVKISNKWVIRQRIFWMLKRETRFMVVWILRIVLSFCVFLAIETVWALLTWNVPGP